MRVSHSEFTTEAYPGDQRLEAWRQALRRVRLDLSGHPDSQAMQGHVHEVVAPLGLGFTRLSGTAQEISNRPRVNGSEAGAWLALQLWSMSRSSGLYVDPCARRLPHFATCDFELLGCSHLTTPVLMGNGLFVNTVNSEFEGDLA